MSFVESLVVSLVGLLVVFSELVLLAVIIVLISKIVRNIEKKKAAQLDQNSDFVSQAAALSNAVPADTVNLHNVDDKTAAMLMAIVSDETGIPLNELRFQSIKALD